MSTLQPVPGMSTAWLHRHDGERPTSALDEPAGVRHVPGGAELVGGRDAMTLLTYLAALCYGLLARLLDRGQKGPM